MAQISDLYLADYISEKVNYAASAIWLDAEKAVATANAWLKENGVDITVLSVDLSEKGPTGVKWEVSDEDAKKVRDKMEEFHKYAVARWG